jgi:predicted Zn-dependent protease
MRSRYLSLLALALLVSCGDEPAPGQPSPRTLFGPSIRRVVLEVDYAPGAEPYTDQGAWELFIANATRLFQGAGKTLEVPTSLGQLERIEVPGVEFTTAQLLSVAQAHRQRVSVGDTATYYVVWLNGYYHDGTRRRTDVLGVSLGTTGVIAVFKPVVTTTAQGSPPYVARFLEQSTLIHEFGHAVGLVNNGVPTTSGHHDGAHGAHCTNEACVMNHSNEGAAAARMFAQRYLSTRNPVLFDQACLDDAAAMVALARQGP